jgi:hypothetical protein
LEDVSAKVAGEAAITVQLGLTIAARAILQRLLRKFPESADGNYGANLFSPWKLDLKSWATDGGEVFCAVRQLQEKPLRLGSRKPQMKLLETTISCVDENVGAPFGLRGENERKKSLPVFNGSKFGQPRQLDLVQRRNLFVARARDHAQSDTLASEE